ncbi:MAG: transporter substrate-binding protein [Lachnospiraceae bacterium]|nr:transporter substrate-binding protein [Lachnospiraceae bacterium]
MKKFMKLISVATACVLCCGVLAGCGGSGESASATSGAATAETTEASTEATTEASTEGASGETIKIGLLYSFGGHESTLESCMYNGAMLAINEINAAGGINGKLIEPISEDYNGDPSLAAERALKLITEDEVVAIVGCCSSSSRQAVKSVVEEYDNLLVYDITYEGQEYSDNIIYLGLVPNQQSSILVPYAVENYGGNFFFLGNDYVYPRSTNEQAKVYLEEAGGTTVGEEYVEIGGTDFSAVIAKIMDTKPDVVYCDLVGESQIAFYKQFANYGLADQGITCVNVALDELVASASGWDAVEGMVACYDYFVTLDNPESQTFVESYNATFSDGSCAASASEVPYMSVMTLAQVLSTMDDYSSGSAIAAAYSGLEIVGPAGEIVCDAENHHFALPIYIATAHDGKFEIEYASDGLIDPIPFNE